MSRRAQGGFGKCHTRVGESGNFQACSGLFLGSMDARKFAHKTVFDIGEGLGLLLGLQDRVPFWGR